MGAVLIQRPDPRPQNKHRHSRRVFPLDEVAQSSDGPQHTKLMAACLA
jgi:hypothetical protein